MAKLPTDEEVRARAEQLGLALPGEDLDPRTKRRLQSELLTEAQQAETRARATTGKPELKTIASVDVNVPNLGTLHIDITLTPEKDPAHG